MVNLPFDPGLRRPIYPPVFAVKVTTGDHFRQVNVQNVVKKTLHTDTIIRYFVYNITASEDDALLFEIQACHSAGLAAIRWGIFSHLS
jgi:hypothetical protein